jgi:hypothetical protein
MDTREHLSIRSSWLVPLLRSATAGILLFIAAWALGSLLSWDKSLPIAVTVGACVAVLTWQVEGAAWRRRIDTLAGVSDPAAPSTPSNTLLELRMDGLPQHLSYANLPVDLERLQVMAAEIVYNGAGLSEAVWVGTWFSRQEWVQLRQALISRGLAKWNSERNTARGVSLTRAGQSAFAYIARERPTTDPENGDLALHLG